MDRPSSRCDRSNAILPLLRPVGCSRSVIQRQQQGGGGVLAATEGPAYARADGADRKRLGCRRTLTEVYEQRNTIGWATKAASLSRIVWWLIE